MDETNVYMNIYGDNFFLVLANESTFDLKLLKVEEFQEIA